MRTGPLKTNLVVAKQRALDFYRHRQDSKFIAQQIEKRHISDFQRFVQLRKYSQPKKQTKQLQEDSDYFNMARGSVQQQYAKLGWQNRLYGEQTLRH